MKLTLTRKLLTIALIGLFSQFSLADDASSQKTIAGILMNLNHFPSDADKATLMAIAQDESNGRGTRAIATAVANISHAATAEDKETMTRIMGIAQAPAEVKALAGIVLGINHVPSADAKEALQAWQ